MIGSGSEFHDYFGFVGAEHHDLLVPIVTRAVRVGFHVVLLQPGSTLSACTATPLQIKRGHYCPACPMRPELPMPPYVALVHDPERPNKTRPMVTAAIQRVTERYGGIPNVAIDLHPSGYSHSTDPQGPATIDGPLQAWLVHGVAGRGGLQVVPPSVIRGEAVRCWGIPSDGK